MQLTKDEFVTNSRKGIGAGIRKYRKKKSLSQKQLAELMGISRPTISKIENGRFAFSVDYLAKFAWYLEFEIELNDTNQI